MCSAWSQIESKVKGCPKGSEPERIRTDAELHATSVAS